jgi:hypothetical protein
MDPLLEIRIFGIFGVFLASRLVTVAIEANFDTFFVSIDCVILL